MLPRDRISEAVKSANASGRAGLVAFLTAGYPSRDHFLAQLVEIAAVSDVVEVGVPFSDPMADGVTIQRSSHSALNAGVSLRWIFDQLETAKGDLGAPILLMSYLNPLLVFGSDDLAIRSEQSGVTGFIVPDLPYEECKPLRDALDQIGVALVQLVTPATPLARLQMLCQASRGFVYAVTQTGITGGASGIPAEVGGYLDGVRAASSLPVCAGFGIRSAEQVREIAGHADGVIVGSALVEVLEAGHSPGEFLQELRG